MDYLIYKPDWLLDGIAEINEYNKDMVTDLIADQIFQANENGDMKYMDALEGITEDEIGNNEELYSMIYAAIATRYKNKELENTSMNIVITYSEDLEADTFLLTPNWLPSLTPQGIMTLITNQSKLVKKDIKVQSFKLFVENDETIINLDLSKELLEINSNYNSKASFYLFGNIINTYLEAYSADKILITVDGGSVKTDDRDYTDYQYFMD
ncbi:MAG TPA: hypothetical protein IAC41_00410 [Candidatus Merdenecus merdavium]|nr:hypothetical protein [Candidatus Merdenecus merdavium]